VNGIDWDVRYSKHWVRYYGWCRASRSFKKRQKKEQVKHLTLSDVNALDIYALELEGVLTRDDDFRIPNVVIVESEDWKIPLIVQAVHPPVPSAVILGKIQELINLDVEQLKSRIDQSGPNWRRSRALRLLADKLPNHELLISEFPFDIINFDVQQSFINPPPPGNSFSRAFEKILRLQSGIGAFLIFLTSRVADDDLRSGYENLFRRDVNRNITTYSGIRDALNSSLKADEYSEIQDQIKRLVIGFAKSLVALPANESGWNVHHHGMYIYDHPQGERMLNVMVELREVGPVVNDSAYVREIVKVIEDMPTYVSYDEAEKDEEARGHLDRVIRRREEIQAKFIPD